MDDVELEKGLGPALKVQGQPTAHGVTNVMQWQKLYSECVHAQRETKELKRKTGFRAR